MSRPTLEQLEAIVGHEFPGGDYLIAHWENFLLTECTGANLLPDGLVHPVALFHVPILGAGTTLAEMFELGMADSPFSIGIESYEWEFFSPLKEEVSYRVSGRVAGAERLSDEADRISFEFELATEEGPCARTTIIWHYRRGGGR